MQSEPSRSVGCLTWSASSGTAARACLAAGFVGACIAFAAADEFDAAAAVVVVAAESFSAAVGSAAAAAAAASAAAGFAAHSATFAEGYAP